MQINIIKNLIFVKNPKIMNITLLGYMGSGKSTVGKSLANSLQLDFIDLDEYISAQEKKSIHEIFSEYGEIYFRKKENFYLKELLEEDHRVLSLGGGTPVYHNNMNLINKRSLSFYLKMNPSELALRLNNEKEHRPLISHLEDEDLLEFIAKHLFERSHFYELSTYKIQVKQKNPNELCDEIIDLLQLEK